jgi:hypothetical protein
MGHQSQDRSCDGNLLRIMRTSKPLMLPLLVACAGYRPTTPMGAKDPVKVGVPAPSSSLVLGVGPPIADEVGPRLSGSRGSKAAVGWADKTLVAEGLVKVHGGFRARPRRQAEAALSSAWA